jgi:hypothetical protein
MLLGHMLSAVNPLLASISYFFKLAQVTVVESANA